MRIAPIDVAHKNFSRKLMGFDGDEVAGFLRDVADQMEELVRERNSLKEQLREKELSIMDYKSRDETLKTTITTATKMSEQIRQDAEREGKLIVADAAQKAEMIVKDARDSLKRIYQEISEGKRMRMQFDISMRSLIHAHLAMLDQGHMMVPDPQVPQTLQQQNAANAPAGHSASAPGSAPSGNQNANHSGASQIAAQLGQQTPQSFVGTSAPPQGASAGGRPPHFVNRPVGG